MTYVLWTGMALGIVIGLLHAVHTYRQRLADAAAMLARHPAKVRALAVYHGVWTFALWTLFGSYVLVLWVVSVVAYSVFKIVPRSASG